MINSPVLQQSGGRDLLHVDVVLVVNILLVNNIGVNPLLWVLASQDISEAFLVILAKSTQILAGILAKKQQLSLVSLRGGVALETILISALFLTHLTIPAELL